MSTVLPVKVNVEFFVECPTYTDSSSRVVHAFWDHFLKGDWAGSPSAGLSNQADSAVLTVQTGETEQFLTASFDSFSTVDYPVLVGRVTSFSATNFIVQVQRSDTSAWVTVYTGTEAERFYIEDLTEFIEEGNIKGLRIYCTGSPDDTITVDYMVICKKAFFPSSADLKGRLTVTKSLLNDEVNGATVTLSNFLDLGDQYLNLDDCGYGIIWASRDEESLTDLDNKIFGGKISSIKQNYYAYNAADVIVKLHGHASELFASPALVYKLYEDEEAQTIIEDTLDLCGYLSKYPHGVGWFDDGGPYGDTDDRLASTHSVEYDEVKPFNVIPEIAEKASNPDDPPKIGFDIYETPSGCLVGHLRESQDFVCPVSPTLKSAVKVIDPHRIVNRQLVYGAAGKKFPTDEIWTESTEGWTVDDGNLSAETDLFFMQGGEPYYYTPKEGTYFLWCEYSANKATFRRNISDNWYIFGKRKHQILQFWRFRHPQTFPAQVARVELWAPDNDNKFYSGLKLFGLAGGWKQFELTLGEDATYDEDDNPNGVWKKTGSPDWTQVTQICFRIEDSNGTGFGIDDLRLAGSSFSNIEDVSKDSTSIKKYGICEAEPIIDMFLMRDAECKAKGDAIIASKKDPPITVEPFVVEGDARYRQGDLMTDGVDYFRIIKVEQLLIGVDWKSRITVSEVN